MKVTIELSQAEVSGITYYLAEVLGVSVTAINVVSIAEEVGGRLYLALHDTREAISDHVMRFEKEEERSHSPKKLNEFKPDSTTVYAVEKDKKFLSESGEWVPLAYAYYHRLEYQAEEVAKHHRGNVYYV